jgi:endonuclease/exonuclease/phosphatase family metal-dependent hydrolase
MQTRRTVLAILLTLPLLTGAANEPAKPQAAKPERDPRTLRVMTYNIHIGKGIDGKADLARIANVIKEADADVVALQEVDVRTRRSGTDLHQLEELVKLTGLHGRFGKARDFDGGEYGQAILSRQPIENLEVHKLPGADAQEERIALLTTIKQPRPLPDLLFVATHLHHVAEHFRMPQAAEINRVLKEPIARGDAAVILLGDLNAKPDGEVMRMMRQTWDDTGDPAKLTFPADKPDRNIDYVLLPKGHMWEVVSSQVIDEPVASDHRPVVVELKWK